MKKTTIGNSILLSMCEWRCRLVLFYTLNTTIPNILNWWDFRIFNIENICEAVIIAMLVSAQPGIC